MLVIGGLKPDPNDPQTVPIDDLANKTCGAQFRDWVKARLTVVSLSFFLVLLGTLLCLGSAATLPLGEDSTNNRKVTLYEIGFGTSTSEFTYNATSLVVSVISPYKWPVEDYSSATTRQCMFQRDYCGLNPEIPADALVTMGVNCVQQTVLCDAARVLQDHYQTPMAMVACAFCAAVILILIFFFLDNTGNGKLSVRAYNICILAFFVIPTVLLVIGYVKTNDFVNALKKLEIVTTYPNTCGQCLLAGTVLSGVANVIHLLRFINSEKLNLQNNTVLSDSVQAMSNAEAQNQQKPKTQKLRSVSEEFAKGNKTNFKQTQKNIDSLQGLQPQRQAGQISAAQVIPPKIGTIVNLMNSEQQKNVQQQSQLEHIRQQQEELQQNRNPSPVRSTRGVSFITTAALEEQQQRNASNSNSKTKLESPVLPQNESDLMAMFENEIRGIGTRADTESHVPRTQARNTTRDPFSINRTRQSNLWPE